MNDESPRSHAARVGGMAFGDGVLMRSSRYWAWARADGSLSCGAFAVNGGGSGRRAAFSRCLRLPLIRSCAAFFQMLAFAIARHRETGRTAKWRMLACLVAYLALTAALSFLPLGFTHSRLLADGLQQVIALVLGLATLAAGMGRTVWRYHGAEHKAVAAYEAGADLRDMPMVLRSSRIHDRCGTNLVPILIVLTVCATPIEALSHGQLLAILWTVPAFGLSLELLRRMTRRPPNLPGRLVLLPGRLMQRWITTREPGTAEVEVACAALRTLLELETGSRIVGR